MLAAFPREVVEKVGTRAKIKGIFAPALTFDCKRLLRRLSNLTLEFVFSDV